MVVTIDKVIEAQALAVETATQMSELIVLIRALELSQGGNVNMHIDSKHDFKIVYVHRAIWKGRELLTLGN